LAWVAGYVMRQFTCPKAVTHPSTNRARCRATALIETNALLLHQTANPNQQTGQSGDDSAMLWSRSMRNSVLTQPRLNVPRGKPACQSSPPTLTTTHVCGWTCGTRAGLHTCNTQSSTKLSMMRFIMLTTQSMITQF